MPELNTFVTVAHGKLEVSYAEGLPEKPVMLMCHPHSLMGGTMTNKVVTTVTRAFHGLGYTTIRFNFRGVGLTTGEYAEGVGEAEDTQQLIAWARQQWPGRSIVLGGFSFGAYVALRAAQQESLQALLLLAPAVDRMNFEPLVLPSCPCYLVVAEQDEVVSTPAILKWATQHPFRKVIEITDASHFFHGKLLELRDFIQDEFK